MNSRKFIIRTFLQEHFFLWLVQEITMYNVLTEDGESRVSVPAGTMHIHKVRELTEAELAPMKALFSSDGPHMEK